MRRRMHRIPPAAGHALAILSLVAALLFLGGWFDRAEALVIDPVFDPVTWSSAPAGATEAVESAVTFWEERIRNPGTVRIGFGWGNSGSTAVGSGVLGLTRFPSTVIEAPVQVALDFQQAAAMQPGNVPLVTAAAHVPLTFSNPLGPSLFAISDAEYLALKGVPPPPDPPLYATIGFGDPSGGWDFGGGVPAPDRFDFVAVAEHEISHALGRFDLAQSYADHDPDVPLFLLTPLDLFKYDCGTTTLDPSLSPTCFSFDGGLTQPRDREAGLFDVGLASSDWTDAAGCPLADLFDARFCAGVAPRLSAIDLTEMCALGWDACPVPEPSRLGLLALALAALAAAAGRRRVQIS